MEAGTLSISLEKTLTKPKEITSYDDFSLLLNFMDKKQWNEGSQLLKMKDKRSSVAVMEDWELMDLIIRAELNEEDPQQLIYEFENLVDLNYSNQEFGTYMNRNTYARGLYTAMFLHQNASLTSTSLQFAERFVTEVSNVAGADGVPNSWLLTAHDALSKAELNTSSSIMEIMLTISPEGAAPSQGPDDTTAKTITPPVEKSPLIEEQPKLVLPWDLIQSSSPKNPKSEAMNVLLQMGGLTSVKQSFLDLYQKIVMSKHEQKMPLDSFNCNVQFIGNPGTGKTTVAELFARFLTEIGLFDFDCKVINKTGMELISDGVQGLEKLLSGLKDDGGGVFFIDEAYQLNTSAGDVIINTVLRHSERLKGQYGYIVWIIAGYKKQMEDLFKLNPGLVSRFPLKYHFEDYNDEELESILKGFLDRGGRDIKLPVKSKGMRLSSATATSATSSPYSPSFSSASGGLSNYSVSTADATDQWGNKWKWDNKRSTFVDSYQNISAYGPSNNRALGTTNNPIISSNGVSWIFDPAGKGWYNPASTSPTRFAYPGKEAIEPPITPFKYEDAKWIRLAVIRVGLRRGGDGFGNARDIRSLFHDCHSRQARRINRQRLEGKNPDIFLFVRDDFLGPKATFHQLESCAAWKELQTMEGLATVKQSIQDMLQLVITNAEREEQEKPLLHVNLNRIFLGNPGTGKTTVAKLYARILGHLGMLSKGEVILRTASDFVGGALGKSEEITRGILEQSKGCVLVIDEAYGLYQSVGNNSKGSNEPFRDAVINTLVEQIQGLPGEDRAVIMLGYRKQMEEMLTNVNPGLSRRFQLENAFEFDDYDDDALGRILIRSVKDEGLKIKPMVALFAIEQLSKAKARPHFGNAGAVNNLLSNAKLRMQKRMFARSSGLKGRSSGSVDDPIDVDELMKEDFVPEDWTDEKVSPEALLNEFVGNDEIKSKLQKYCNLVEYNLKKGKDRNNNVPYTYLFLGAPGTGKTTIARMMGKMFQSLQLIPFDEVIEVSASDFMTGYVGQSGMKTRIMFEKAKGKVLFIDEAYQLNPAKGGQFMAEVVDEIVKLMTSEEYQKKIMIILAGYEHDMNEMLRINKGLLSRFQERVHFHPLTTKQIEILILKKLSDNDEGKVAEDACAVLCSIAGRLKDLPNFSNGRDVETFVAKVINEKVHRLHENDSDKILLSDVESALMEMKSMKPACDPAFLPFPFTAVPSSNVASAMEAPPPPTVYEIATDYEADVGPAQMEAEEEEEEEEVNFELMKEDEGEEEQTKSMDWGPAQFLTSLQSILDEAGWNNEEKIRLLSGYPLDHPEVMRVRAKLAASTTYSAKTIEELVSSWQRNQGTVQAIQAETEKAKGTKALVPIWRCGVCGRADQPYIACYVAPFVVRYEERLLN